MGRVIERKPPRTNRKSTEALATGSELYAAFRQHVPLAGPLTAAAVDRIAMLALAHSHKSRVVWGFEQLIARGVDARPGRNAESLNPPKPFNRLPTRCRLDGGRTQPRVFDLELFDMLCAYVVVRERCDTRVAAQARFGRSAANVW